MKFFCELKKIVDDSYDIEIGRGLSDTLISLSLIHISEPTRH